MDFIEKTGKTVEDALNDALAELKTTADKVNVEVIEEAKNGIFGLFAKKAKIRVTLKDAARKIGDIVDETVDSIKEDYKAGKQELPLQGKLPKKKKQNQQFANMLLKKLPLKPPKNFCRRFLMPCALKL